VRNNIDPLMDEGGVSKGGGYVNGFRYEGSEEGVMMWEK